VRCIYIYIYIYAVDKHVYNLGASPSVCLSGKEEKVTG